MTQPGGIAVQRFVDTYRPDAGTRVPFDAFLGYADRAAPRALVELWRTCGLGFYGEQRIALVDPGHWMGLLQTWLGGDITSFPFAVTSFGHVYHYDRVTGGDRIQCLDPHFQSNSVIKGDLVTFFNDHLTGPSSHLKDLEGPRGGARSKLGELQEGEIYYFDPILALGGQVRPENLAKGDGVAHLSDIHQKVAAKHR